MLKVLPKTLKTAVLAGTMSLATLSCIPNHNIEETNTSGPKEQIENLEKSSSDSLDFSKPNLPQITQDNIFYRNSEGKLVTVNNQTKYGCPVQSLYSAIAKMSTPEKPNIEDTDKFFIEVEKNIKKSPIGEAQCYDLLNIQMALNNTQASDLFNRLFSMFTAPDSDGGKTITVKEYTYMMDAWSSTQVEK